jgi:hypothetical protein
MNSKNSMGDALGLDVTYFGQNGVKQHMFGNGTPIATDIFNTLEEAVQRFGKRIKIDPRPYVQSLNFKQGYEATAYAPRPNADRVERIEYGMGYLKGLIERGEKARVVPKPVDMRMPHEVLADRVKAEKARVPVAPVKIVAPTKPAPEPGIADRLAASRAALMSPPVPVADDDMEIGDAPTALDTLVAGGEIATPVEKADMSASIGNVVRRGRGKPKTVQP